ncbi:Homeobox protein HD-11 [Nosema bombycis CQ1]|uniref:Homeobox protein HD-11 n=1 Tax=Nosema bombycis (strain CQ1 / CVCC 102059) TaxID=578461 RepID=R0KM55_NOSB1|nr:Homeobox protein HD-11 [Nosema bombycis CQ1]|eukprot:EOB11232.1 Homeobox protein HD-11 [Nosema bombycis CQ1]
MNDIVYEAALGLLKLFYSNNESQTKRNKLQTSVLHSMFDITNYPSSSTQIDLSILLKMQIKSVKIWFQNARQQRRKKMSFKREKETGPYEMVDVPIPLILEKIREINKQQ